MADSIESQIKELADLSLVQQRFVSDVSHELRTPLTTIRLAADMINDQRDEFDPATARAAELLNAQVQRFETLLTDLLEISRYDAGSVQLELEPTSLAHLAEDVIGSMHQLAEQHGTDVRLVAPGGYSPVEMDPRRVRRIVRNLLGNAIEHGEGRPIVVTVDSNQQAVAIGVRDFGLGMTPEDVERVFDRFWRADPSRTRTIGGTGLGLSIALGDARLHGGELAVWSELGRGSNFVLTLPRQGGRLTGPSPIPLDPETSRSPRRRPRPHAADRRPARWTPVGCRRTRESLVNRRRGILSAVVAVAAARALGVRGPADVSGPVNPGLEAGEDAGSPTSCSAPTSRSPARRPEQIVDGFIRPDPAPARRQLGRRPHVPRAGDPRDVEARGQRHDRSAGRPPARLAGRGRGRAVAGRRRDRRRDRRVPARRGRGRRSCRSGSPSRTTASGASPRPRTASCSTATSSRTCSTATR